MANTTLEEVEKLAIQLSVEDQQMLVAHLTSQLQKQKNGASMRPYGLCKGVFDVPDDFDAPLPDDVVDAFEGK